MHGRCRVWRDAIIFSWKNRYTFDAHSLCNKLVAPVQCDLSSVPSVQLESERGVRNTHTTDYVCSDSSSTLNTFGFCLASSIVSCAIPVFLDWWTFWTNLVGTIFASKTIAINHNTITIRSMLASMAAWHRDFNVDFHVYGLWLILWSDFFCVCKKLKSRGLVFLSEIRKKKRDLIAIAIAMTIWYTYDDGNDRQLRFSDSSTWNFFLSEMIIYLWVDWEFQRQWMNICSENVHDFLVRHTPGFLFNSRLLIECWQFPSRMLAVCDVWKLSTKLRPSVPIKLHFPSVKKYRFVIWLLLFQKVRATIEVLTEIWS